MTTKHEILADFLINYDRAAAYEELAKIDSCACHGDTCYACAVRDCPYSAPEHYFDDGCPSCLDHDMDVEEQTK